MRENEGVERSVCLPTHFEFQLRHLRGRSHFMLPAELVHSFSHNFANPFGGAILTSRNLYEGLAKPIHLIERFSLDAWRMQKQIVQVARAPRLRHSCGQRLEPADQRLVNDQDFEGIAQVIHGVFLKHLAKPMLLETQLGCNAVLLDLDPLAQVVHETSWHWTGLEQMSLDKGLTEMFSLQTFCARDQNHCPVASLGCLTVDAFKARPEDL
mmetsp:Transcript_76415/g.155047  ORF Transcript_76415/g.155047 Transcript_76415/m.155047 type:complete len:211 (-) Transcript_76415:117-749(-)